MTIQLTKSECNNVKTALLLTVKHDETGEAEMRTLLVLAQKFSWTEDSNKIIKPKKTLTK